MLPVAVETARTEYVGVYIGDRRLIGLVCHGLETTVISAHLADLVDARPSRSRGVPTIAVECTAKISLIGPATEADFMVVDLAPLPRLDVLVGDDLLSR